MTRRRSERERERDKERAKRPHEVRPTTLDLRRASARARAEWRAEVEAFGEYPRPRTRGECACVPRPCPYVACRWHLYLDAQRSGNVRLNFPDREPSELHESCALDIADRGGVTLDDVGRALNITREATRLIERAALLKLARSTRLNPDLQTARSA